MPGGDGLLLDGGRLIVVQGGPPAQLSFVKLSHGARRGEVSDTRTSPLLKGPSTIARQSGLYLVVNADFATSTKPFTVAGLPVKVNKKDDHGHGNAGDDNHHDQGDDHGDDGPNHDQGDDDDDNGDDDHGHADATPTPYYGGPGNDDGTAGATATPTPYYGGAQGGDDNGSGGGNSGSGGGGHGHG